MKKPNHKPNFDKHGFNKGIVPALNTMNIPHKVFKVGKKTRVHVEVRLSDDSIDLSNYN